MRAMSELCARDGGRDLACRTVERGERIGQVFLKTFVQVGLARVWSVRMESQDA